MTNEQEYIKLQDEDHSLYMTINHDYYNNKITKEERDKLVLRQKEVKKRMKELKKLHERTKKIKKISEQIR